MLEHLMDLKSISGELVVGHSQEILRSITLSQDLVIGRS